MLARWYINTTKRQLATGHATAYHHFVRGSPRSQSVVARRPKVLLPCVQDKTCERHSCEREKKQSKLATSTKKLKNYRWWLENVFSRSLNSSSTFWMLESIEALSNAFAKLSALSLIVPTKLQHIQTTKPNDWCPSLSVSDYFRNLNSRGRVLEALTCLHAYMGECMTTAEWRRICNLWTT